jgi:hypothetical protein
MPGESPVFERAAVALIRRWFTRSYLRAYRQLRPIDPAAISAWRPVLLAARLGEGIEAERDDVLGMLRAALAE